MSSGRHTCPNAALLLLLVLPSGLWAQQNPPRNPIGFETVPTAPSTPPAPAAPKPAAPKPAPGAPRLETPAPVTTPSAAVEDVIDSIEFRGARRVPQDTLRALIFSRKGDRYDRNAINRDLITLWNSKRFDDIRVEREAGPSGWIIRFLVTERRVVRSIKYDGMKSITVSEILDRFKERRVGLSVETQYDPANVQRGANVIKEYLAERGRQFAVVTPDIRQIPPSSLEVNFKVTEGPKVKMGNIAFEGNTVFNDRIVRRAMRNLRPIGVPRSILLENIFAKSFDSTKLDQDKEMIRNFYQEQGYFAARALEHTVNVRDIGGGKFRFPLVYMNKPGKRADLTIELEEGRQYHLNKINFVGAKLFRTPETLMAPLFGMKEGDVFSVGKLRKGIEQMRKLYGQFGYIDMVPEPSPEPIPNTNKVDLTFNIDEGKQFFVRRIDFSGNTTTRDKVIRREILIDEGQVFNNQYWEMSVLRLNQLGYFEALKENEAADIKRDTRTNTVDITLKVRERGKNSVSMNGGVSGIAGSFLGFGYSTNNFLGLGETLSIDAQFGDRIRSGTFGFTEPYLFDRPIQLGFTVYTQRFNYDQGREVSILSGRDLSSLYAGLGQQNLQKYISNGYGATLSVSTPWRRTFARMSLTASYGIQNIKTLTDAAASSFQYIAYAGFDGPNQLNGIKTLSLTPSWTYNTVDHPVTPTRGKSIYISSQFALPGGNVRMIEPTIDYKHFRHGLKANHVIGWHVLGRFITGYGGRVAPPFNRFYMGGENDIRGFQNWQITPVAFLPSSGGVQVYNADGSARLQRHVDANGVVSFSPATQAIPAYQVNYLGGDTQAVANLEYRIPIAGPLVLAAFADVGVNRLSRPGQLRLSPSRLNDLNNLFPQAGFGQGITVAAASQAPRMSTGLEAQIMMPMVQAPFRLYWAYNPLHVQDFFIPPIVADRSYFPNEYSFARAAAVVGQAIPWYEKAKTFRFTISRTF
jgi:outer membrane protein insertion porin family